MTLINQIVLPFWFVMEWPEVPSAVLWTAGYDQAAETQSSELDLLDPVWQWSIGS